MKYSEVKHDDKFHEALSHAWDKMQPYALHVGIAAGLVLALAAVWMVVARRDTSSAERPWAERYAISRRYIDAFDEENSAEQSRKLLGELDAFVDEHRGTSAAAITLLEVAQQHLNHAEDARLHDADKADDDLKRAAKAAEQFVADYADHPLLPVAQFTAGKARLDLEEYAKAGEHFARAAAATDVPFLKTLAQLHEALCHEKAGEVAKARAAFETVRDSKGPDGQPTWCAEQADYHLTRLRREPAQGS